MSPYDWTAEVSALPMRTMLVYADGDSIGIDHVAEFYGLLGGGQRDAGWDGSGAPANTLAVLPHTTHYDIFASPLLPSIVADFVS